MEDWREQLYGKKRRRYDDSSDSEDENRTGDEQYVSPVPVVRRYLLTGEQEVLLL